MYITLNYPSQPSIDFPVPKLQPSDTPRDYI